MAGEAAGGCSHPRIEIRKVLVLIDRIDADLPERGLTRPRSSEARNLLTVRRQMSAQLERWLVL